MNAFTSDHSPGGSGLVKGNPCRVFLLPEAPARAPGPGPSARCFTWPTGERSAGVRCWSESGRQIRCCGHGMLSCAQLWIPRWGGEGRLLSGGSEIPCLSREGRLWLGFPRLETVSCDSPPWVRELLNSEPEHCARAGDEDGYLVVELPRDTPLTAVDSPGDALAGHTQRALIVTCSVSPSAAFCGETIQYRYFAPQYGVPEDTATGSAMRLLADYWHRRGLGTRLKAVQRSARGGLLYSHLHDGKAWVGGRVSGDDRRPPAGE